MDQILYKNLPPAKHSKDRLFQVIDRDGRLYRSTGEFWVPVSADIPEGAAPIAGAIDPVTGAYTMTMGGIAPTFQQRVAFARAFGVQMSLSASTEIFVSAAVATEQVVRDTVIPGALLQESGELLVQIQGRGNGTGNKNFLIYYGGVLLGTGTLSSTNISGTCQFRIKNITRNSQIGQPNGLRSLGESTTLPLTGAVNTDVDQTLSIRVSKATTSELFEVTRWSVSYVPPFV